MACFLAPMTEGIVVNILQKKAKKKEENGVTSVSPNSTSFVTISEHSLLTSKKLGVLKNLLYGGSFLLGIEHLWHGEVIPYPPFLSALSSSSGIVPMLKEICTVGVTMAVVITMAWGVTSFALDKWKEKSPSHEEE